MKIFTSLLLFVLVVVCLNYVVYRNRTYIEKLISKWKKISIERNGTSLTIIRKFVSEPNVTKKLPSKNLYPLEISEKQRESICTSSPHTPLRVDNVFLYFANCFGPREVSDIVYFNGDRVKSIFDLDNKLPHIPLHLKLKVHKWSDLTKLVNKTRDIQKKKTRSIHVHNELTFGDLLMLINQEFGYRYKKESKELYRSYIKQGLRNVTTTEMHQIMDDGQPPIVITNTADENWGFLSTTIVNRTTKWINMTNHLRIHSSNYKTVQNFLNSDKVTLLICSSHVDPQIGTHRKILGLPLGVRAGSFIFNRAQKILRIGVKKTRLLLINNSGWGGRAVINEEVIRNFNYTILNTYTLDRKHNKDDKGKQVYRSPYTNKTLEIDHYLETAQSKFVLCPSGLGFDTYRLWETLLLGAIPIVESNAGLDRTYSNLPVLVVNHFHQVTPQLLNLVYPCFIRHAHLFHYQHLTVHYWLNLITIAIENGHINHVDEEHPYVNKYCNFLIPLA